MNESCGNPTSVTHPKMVFVVDDALALRDLYSSLIEEVGSEVTTFDDGEDALRRIPRLARPDLLLVDFTLPRMSGVEFLARLTELVPDLRESTFIVGFSQFSSHQPFVTEFRGVVDAYIEKPNDIDVFMQTVEKLLVQAESAKTSKGMKAPERVSS